MHGQFNEHAKIIQSAMSDETAGEYGVIETLPDNTNTMLLFDDQQSHRPVGIKNVSIGDRKGRGRTDTTQGSNIKSRQTVKADPGDRSYM